MEMIGRDLTEMQRVPLTAQHVEAMRALDSGAEYAASEFWYNPAV